MPYNLSKFLKNFIGWFYEEKSVIFLTYWKIEVNRIQFCYLDKLEKNINYILDLDTKYEHEIQ